MKTVLYLVLCITLTMASKDSSPFKFAPCKQDLLALDTGIVIRNKDWKKELFVNIVSKSELSPGCVRSTRWTELDTTSQPPFVVFHQIVHYKLPSGKGYAKFTEMYQVTSDHYVFKYMHSRDGSAEVHFKWLKFIPGILEIYYMCSDELIFANNAKDFVFVTTPSAVPSSTISGLIKEILHENKLNLKGLTMVDNCNCLLKQADEQPHCVNKTLLAYLKN